MQITAVEAIPVNIPITPLEEGGIAPYVTNHNSLEDMDRVLVRVDTDEGISGWGEVRVFLSPDATVSVIEDGIAPMIVGQSPFEIERFRRQLFIEYANTDMFFAPIETACWDIVGKATERPIYELLGGWTTPGQTGRKHRNHQTEYDDDRSVEFAYCLGILPPEESAERAKEVADAGYSVLKTKAGRDWRTDVERIIAMDEAVDGELEFRLDPNQGWTTDQATRVGAMLDDAGVYLQYMEQPIRVDAHGSLAALRSRTTQPIGPNEDTYIAHNLQQLIAANAVDVAVLDLTPAGGIAGLRQQAGIAEDAGIPVTHHCAFDLGIRTAAIMHAVVGIPGFDLPSDTVYYSWEDDVITRPFEIESGRITVPSEPGLGITVDDSTVEQYRID
ncbi:mandelate racemase/muconate lactonizing enzyme family protein [Natrarchaeobius chitinivorans]|uniref:glucarate dehydratase n=1 Tax=Natrarchaeobius chitinivorans TaxID=1679083 RepID=A0A3N6M054_NATCH|nr:mandelate racemase/muconate lactonizing enzyme family protein [Natrarchaeobius chitinivorans]RQG93634.1 mandelate racemase/muconate lactonizing enzyme family protein [Natrarchaeobius chitinivorans]